MSQRQLQGVVLQQPLPGASAEAALAASQSRGVKSKGPGAAETLQAREPHGGPECRAQVEVQHGHGEQVGVPRPEGGRGGGSGGAN